MYKVLLTKGAEKEYVYLRKTDKAIFERVRAALYYLARNPIEGKLLKFSLKGQRSYRVGTYRILYSVEHKILTVYILDVGHRREVYS